MSTTYHALARVFGTFRAVLAVRKLFLEAEIAAPGYSFSIELLPVSGEDTMGFIVRGDLNRQPPAFAEFDFLSETFAQHPQLIIELLVSADDSQTHKVFQAGQLLYEADREEATGDICELGAPGLQYCYGKETGIRDAFFMALEAANVTHRLHRL
jgi:hypothetical protein